MFAPLQSEKGKELSNKYNIDSVSTDSFILIENNKAYLKSTAFMRITRHLSGLYPLLYAFMIVPPFIRNGIYDFVSRHRYSWFGKTDSCMIPTEEVKKKFIS